MKQQHQGPQGQGPHHGGMMHGGGGMGADRDRGLFDSRGGGGPQQQEITSMAVGHYGPAAAIAAQQQGPPNDHRRSGSVDRSTGSGSGPDSRNGPGGHFDRGVIDRGYDITLLGSSRSKSFERDDQPPPPPPPPPRRGGGEMRDRKSVV